MDATIERLPRPVHEESATDTLTKLKAKARCELNAALRARNLDEVIEWANPAECEQRSGMHCLLGKTLGRRSSYYGNYGGECAYPGTAHGAIIPMPDGVEDIVFPADSAVVLLVKLFDSGVLGRLEAL